MSAQHDAQPDSQPDEQPDVPTLGPVSPWPWTSFPSNFTVIHSFDSRSDGAVLMHFTQYHTDGMVVNFTAWLHSAVVVAPSRELTEERPLPMP